MQNHNVSTQPMALHMGIVATVLGADYVTASAITRQYPNRDLSLIGLGESLVTLQILNFREIKAESLDEDKAATTRYLEKDGWPYIVCLSIKTHNLVITMVERHKFLATLTQLVN